MLLRWSQLSVKCSLQSCYLCPCIILVILLFSGASCGSLRFCFRTVFLLSMAALICSRSSLRILVWSILWLSAASIASVSILFPWCTSVGNGVFVRVCSISSRRWWSSAAELINAVGHVCLLFFICGTCCRQACFVVTPWVFFCAMNLCLLRIELDFLF